MRRLTRRYDPSDATAIRAALPGLRPTWVWPAWLERQRDVSSASWFPTAHNATARNWTAIGALASPRRAIVDRAGLVTPHPRRWSVDWWVRTEDGWRFPSREVAVRQALMGAEPVVETVLPIRGGDVAARAYAIQGSGGELVALEVENRSTGPVAVAFCVRPYNAERLVWVRRVEVGADKVLVDGEEALLLPRPPGDARMGSYGRGDAGEHLDDPDDAVRTVECPVGLAHAAVVFPLAHRATVRVAIPLERGARMGSLPAAADAARAWTAHARRGMRVELPAGRLRDAFEANRRYVLQAFSGDGVVATPSRPEGVQMRDASALIGALDVLGFHELAAQALGALPERQRFDGAFGRAPGRFGRAGGGSDSAAAAIHAWATHWSLTRDRGVLGESAASVALAARAIDRSRTKLGLVATADGPEWAGPSAHLFWDSWWGVRGLLDAAMLLRETGADNAGDECERVAGELRAALDRVRGQGVQVAGADRARDAGAVASLVACRPLALLDPVDPDVLATVAAVTAFCEGPAVVTFGGRSPMATIQLALVELAAGDENALTRLRWLVEQSGTTFTWPDVMHPRRTGGIAGEGHSGAVAAGFVALMRRVLVDDDGDGLVILRLLPDEWRGEGIEVHDAPTRYGPLSYAIRWHGPNPALLWNLAARADDGPVKIQAPGLDPGWSTVDREGETLVSLAR